MSQETQGLRWDLALTSGSVLFRSRWWVGGWVGGGYQTQFSQCQDFGLSCLSTLSPPLKANLELYMVCDDTQKSDIFVCGSAGPKKIALKL